MSRVIHRGTRTIAESEDNARDTLRDDILASGHANKHGLAVEHAVTTFFEVWPRKR